VNVYRLESLNENLKLRKLWLIISPLSFLAFRAVVGRQHSRNPSASLFSPSAKMWSSEDSFPWFRPSSGHNPSAFCRLPERRSPMAHSPGSGSIRPWSGTCSLRQPQPDCYAIHCSRINESARFSDWRRYNVHFQMNFHLDCNAPFVSAIPDLQHRFEKFILWIIDINWRSQKSSLVSAFSRCLLSDFSVFSRVFHVLYQ
jgi:hypothetical protein